jgi:4-hydroxy-4-methyl-2-oxoglutarate aldolase
VALLQQRGSKATLLATGGSGAAPSPVFGRNPHPATGSNDGPGAINVPIQCGGVLVHPGDIVRADASGVVVIPRTQASKVFSLARAVDEREQAWRAAIDAGATLPAATGIDDRIAAIGR